MIRSFCVVASALAGAALLVGCGEGEKIYDVSGTITYEGKPIPKGLIFFDPEKGTPGTQGFANIENGHYDTSVSGKGKGIRGGTYAIRVSGFDGVVGPEAPFGKTLFPEHQFTKELPAQKQTLDYDVKKPK
ncbi:MAG: hypothetical protein J0I06_10370 [Planctomycetes bacterium]|nr:hypothetical protein [Planctomycetota bacterium]